MALIELQAGLRGGSPLVVIYLITILKKKMSLSREEKYAALQEAQRILQLEKKWRRLVPDEPKPDFKRAARIILQRALDHKTVSHEPELQIHNGLMHEQDTREARLIERTLRSGLIHPEVLRSFREGARSPTTKPLIQSIVGSRTPVPAGEFSDFQLDTDTSDLHESVHDIHFPREELEFPTHINMRTGEMKSKHSDFNHMIMLDPQEQPPVDPMRDRVE